MKCSDIHIRDPFILTDDGKYYMYGSRAKNFAMKSGGFDVYVSDDLENWSEPTECFNSEKFNMNRGANWAPEVHKYGDKYYMFATFTKEDNLRGTYILRADSPKGPFVPHSNGAVTPEGWECLDGTFYISKDGTPYMVFCHEHTQIVDGTICYVKLSDDLSKTVGEVVTIFSASSCPGVSSVTAAAHYVTDGPFMYRTKTDELLMIWSSFINGKYAELLVKFNGGEIGADITHLIPLIDSDGGHGMIFKKEDKLYLTFHSPNTANFERPHFTEIIDNGDTISLNYI